MHVCQARRLTQVSSPAGEAGSVRRRLRMSPCALFSYSRYLRSSGAWLALSASDFLRSAKRGEFVGASFAPVLRRAEGPAELIEFLFELLNRNTSILLLF